MSPDLIFKNQIGGYLLSAIMASPRFDLLAAVRAVAVDHELNTGAVFTVSARFMASPAIPDRIGVNVVFGASSFMQLHRVKEMHFALMFRIC